MTDRIPDESDVGAEGAIAQADHWLLQADESGDINEAAEHRGTAQHILLRALLREVAGLRADLRKRD